MYTIVKEADIHEGKKRSESLFSVLENIRNTGDVKPLFLVAILKLI